MARPNRPDSDYVDLSSYSDLPLKMEEKQEKKLVEKGQAWRSGKKVSSPAELEFLFNKYSQQYGVDKQLMKRIAYCESSFNPQAVNGPYKGMYQYLDTTWMAERRAMGLDPDPYLRYNSEEAIKTTAFKISRDGTGAWPVCGR